ncbi:DUF1064 domain-containing protein [Sporosarcina sp. ANT_H38]|uniref:DUF1064 domain-containing protein n=1 Tax=Sporosarcina sp. ANT_H38 TaxID=2597358 RepID=UPI0011F2BB1E|nr:DUF1064 domain-containing protein [Sporosarcina sp. ANT_H38]KAA0941597.1 DUF1064 domain-containing protein [Sporosarcina sp. ANT_H38]
MRNVQRVPSRSRAPKQPRQFKSKTAVIDGITFDSLTEGAYYVHLKKDQSIKLIEVQPEFKIIDSYEVQCKRCSGTGKRTSSKTGNPINCSLCHGKRRRVKAGAIYTADFRVTYIDGFVEVIDIKGGPVGRDFPLRQKLFELKTGMELIVIRLKNKEWVRD